VIWSHTPKKVCQSCPGAKKSLKGIGFKGCLIYLHVAPTFQASPNQATCNIWRVLVWVISTRLTDPTKMSEQCAKFITVQVGNVITQCLQLWSDNKWLPSIFRNKKNIKLIMSKMLESIRTILSWGEFRMNEMNTDYLVAFKVYDLNNPVTIRIQNWEHG